MTSPSAEAGTPTYCSSPNSTAGAPSAQPYTVNSAPVTLVKSYRHSDSTSLPAPPSASSGLNDSHDARLDDAPMTNTSVAAVHSGPYMSGLAPATDRKGVAPKGYSASLSRPTTSAVSTLNSAL